MNTDQLRYFELTYRERNYSAAARKVPVSHQGLVKSIRALEKELDVPLFTADPETGMPVPTVYADELFEFVGVFSSNLVLLQDTFRKLRGGGPQTIRLGCSLGVHNAFGSRLMLDFAETHPHIELELFESNDRLCEQALLEATYDVAIVVAPETPGCTSELIYSSPMYFWVKRASTLGRIGEAGGTADIRDLAGQLVAIPGKGFKCFDQLRRAAASASTELGGIIETSEIFQIYDFVSRGLGIGFSNGTLVDMPCFNYDKDVVAVPVRGLTWGFAIERLRTHALTDAERLFWEWCVKSARSMPHNDLASG